MIYFNCISVAIVILCFIVCIANKRLTPASESATPTDLIDRYYWYLVAGLFCVVLFMTFFQLGSLPASLNIDEVAMAYDAFLLTTTGADRYGNFLPVYFINFGGGQSVLMGYCVAALMKLFGISTFIIRLPGALMKIALIICGFLMIKDKKQALLFLFILAINPYFIMQSRFGLDCNMMVGCVTLATFLLHRAILREKSFWVAGVFFGITLYTYALSYLILPVYLCFLCLYLLYLKKASLKKLVIFGLPIFCFAIPLMLLLLVNNGIISEIRSFITIPLLPNYRGSEISLSNIFDNLYILPSILTYDYYGSLASTLTFNATSKFGTIYYMGIPFFIAGFVIAIKRLITAIKQKEYDLTAIFLFWFISVLPCQLLITSPNIYKANAIMLPVVYFVYLGVSALVTHHRYARAIVLGLFSLNFVLFAAYYFTTDQIYSSRLFAGDLYEAIEYSMDLEEDTYHIQIYGTDNAVYSNWFLRTDAEFYSASIITGNGKTHIYDDIWPIVETDGYIILAEETTLCEYMLSIGYEVATFDTYNVFYKTES